MILSLASLAAAVVPDPNADPLLKYFPGGFAKRHDTPTSHCTNNTAPSQIRLAYAGTDGMAVRWNTNQKLSKPTVNYGSKKGTLDHQASSDISNTYPTSSTYSNHIVIKDLDPDTTYYYVPQCGDAKNPLSFKTARDIGDDKSFSFAMVGDMGTFDPDGLSTKVGTGAANPLKPGENTTIQSFNTTFSTWDFIWHVGDLALADGAKVYDRILNDFYNEIEGLSMRKPYMVGPGNHEANCDDGSAKNGSVTYNTTICLPGQLNFTGYRNHWNMPSAESKGLENFWYSWGYGMVHFIQFNSETDFPNAPDEPGGEGLEFAGPFAPNGTQLAWLEEDLKKVDRKKTPWIIVGGHRPWYVSSSTCPECQSAFEPLLVKYGVDVVLHGHKHFYERQAPVHPTANGTGVADPNGLNNPSAPWYIINGAADHYDGLDVPVTPFVATSRMVISALYGWSYFTVHNCTHLTQSFVPSSTGVLTDTVTLIKNRTCHSKKGDKGGSGSGGNNHHRHHRLH